MKKNAKKNLGVVVSLSPPFALDFCWGCIPSRQIGPNSQTMMMRFTMHTASLNTLVFIMNFMSLKRKKSRQNKEVYFSSRITCANIGTYNTYDVNEAF